MDENMHHWFDVTISTLLTVTIASIAYVLSFFPAGLGGELIHFAFVLVGGVVTATITHYWRKWLEKRDKESQLKISTRSSETES